MAQGISKSEYAKHRGCAPSAVTRAIKEGRITLLADGSINPRIADVQWAENSRARGDSIKRQAPTPAVPEQPPAETAPAPAPAQPPAEPQPQAEPGSYQDARARRERAEAEEAEMRVARMAGRLVERAGVESAIFQVLRMLRDRYMTVGDNAAPLVVGLADVREIKLIIDEEQRKAFSDVERQILDAIAARVQV